MTFEECKEILESAETRCQVMLASTTSSLIHRLDDLESLQAILQEEQDRHILMGGLYWRACELYRQPGLEGYNHPNDSVLAAYIYLLHKSGSWFGNDLARCLAADVRMDFFTSYHLAKAVIQGDN